jgi:hypothetical protein
MHHKAEVIYFDALVCTCLRNFNVCATDRTKKSRQLNPKLSDYKHGANNSATPLVFQIFPRSKNRIMSSVIWGLCRLMSALCPSMKASPIDQDIWLVDVLKGPLIYAVHFQGIELYSREG